METARRLDPGGSILDLLGQWHRHLLALYSQSTATSYRSVVKRFVWATHIDSPDGITNQVVQDYVILLRQRGLAAATVRAGIAGIMGAVAIFISPQRKGQNNGHKEQDFHRGGVGGGVSYRGEY